jgi:tetratricopeptide (TPR) repeat protein
MTHRARTRSLPVLLRGSCMVLLGIMTVWPQAAALAAKAKPKAPPAATAAGMTVEELVHHSAQALTAGAWQVALEHCNALLRDYGDRPEVLRLKQRVQLTLLRCHLQLGQWSEAAPLFEVALQHLTEGSPEARGELLFHKAACELRLEQTFAACKSISASLLLLPPAAPLRTEAVLLQGACLLANRESMQAGEQMESVLPQLGQAAAERAIPLGMSAFLEAKQPGRAGALLANGTLQFPGIGETITLQATLLQAGSDLLEEGRPAEALACLLRIATPQRLHRAQHQRLASVEKALASVQAQPGASPSAVSALQGRAAQLRLDQETLGNGDAFAAATRIQIAAAYQALERPHEAALVLEDAVRQLPPSELLEHACLELAKTWLQLERWAKVVEASEHFATAYPESKHLPLMLYLRGCALQKAGLFPRAREVFRRLSAEFQGHDLCANARFMESFTLLLDNRPVEALQGFASFQHAYKKHALAEAAAYGLCVAQAQNGPPSAARLAAGAYLAGYPNGENRPAVLLRRAQAAYALREKNAAVGDLEALLASAPGDACGGEAALLLGDCLLSADGVDGALAAWNRVPPSQREAKEEALFKSAKVLHRSGRTLELRELLRAFDSAHVDSARLPEAAHWLRKACTQEGHPEDATTWALEHVALHGNSPAAQGIEPLLAAVGQSVDSEPGREAWRSALQQLATAAEEADQQTLLSRLKWALARQMATFDGAGAGRLFIEAASLSPAVLTGTAVLADAAQALEDTGSTPEALRLWRELLKWHPRAPERDRALYNLARLDFAGGRPEAAWEWVRRFDKGVAGSPLLPRLLLVKARLQRYEGNTAEALRSLDRVLREKRAAAAVKCEALFTMGELHQAAGAPRLALPYLQRVYVSYSGFQPWAAKAYLASAELFSSLGEVSAARNTYTELLASKLAPEAPERAVAASKLKALEDTP